MSLLNKLSSVRKSLPKRVGRGYGSGKGGHNAGRGTKGQNSRQGGGVPLWFEGGQLPLIKRMPMQRGKSKLKVVRPTAEINLTELHNIKADTITLDTLKLEKVIDARFKKAKIVASGEITRKVTVEGIGVTQGAKAAIEKAGGKVV
ncbi:MAG: 50S ribosomal protein L15 [Candidatus Pacebacteria bacterium]|nr:50S ribosomal protein L15 [Candidatus Paceibacterota bacterium]